MIKCFLKLLNNKKLSKNEIFLIIDNIRNLFLNEFIILDVNSPCYIIGDIHGQYYDLLNIFQIIKNDHLKRANTNSCKDYIKPDNNVINYITDNKENIINRIDNQSITIKNYSDIINKYFIPVNIVCLGDYVDRGYHSIETLLFLFLYKIIFKNLYLLKGNHESKLMNGVYGFKDECLSKYDVTVFIKFMDLFEMMSISCVVDKKYFLIHGGIGKINYKSLIKNRVSVDSEKISHDLNYEDSKINNFQKTDEGYKKIKKSPIKKIDLLYKYFLSNVPDKYIDFLWSDPADKGLVANSRGLGYLFGEDIVDEFLDFFDLKCIIRSHQLVYEGYKKDFNGKLITVWSAPNYCYRMGNIGCVMFISNVEDFIVYDKVENQY